MSQWNVNALQSPRVFYLREGSTLADVAEKISRLAADDFRAASSFAFLGKSQITFDAAAATPDASSQTFDLAAGDTVNFAIKTTNPDVKAGLIVQQHYLLRTDPLSGNVFTATDSGRYTFKLSATGPKGQSAMAQATCGPSTQ